MRALLVSSFLMLSACTVVNTTTLPSVPGQPGEVFVTAGDIREPHEVLGLVQATRSGVLLFGFADVVGTDLEAGFKDVLVPQIRAMGGDGAVRVRFHQTQYTPWTKVVGAIFFIFPLPSQVTITAQVVRLKPATVAPAEPAPAPAAP